VKGLTETRKVRQSGHYNTQVKVKKKVKSLFLTKHNAMKT
jgi:hypothetical protein